MGGQWWHVVECYIALYDALTVEAFVADIVQSPCGEELLVAGNFNSYLEEPEGNAQDEEISMALVAAGLEDICSHFLPRRKTWPS